MGESLNLTFDEYVAWYVDEEADFIQRESYDEVEWKLKEARLQITTVDGLRGDGRNANEVSRTMHGI